MAKKMAFLGLGKMGQAMVRNLVQKSEIEAPIRLYNRSYEVTEKHAAELGNAIACKHIHDAVGPSDIIWTCLADEQAVFDIFDQIKEESALGKLFIECSTISPPGTDAVAERVTGMGATFVAMPVFGEPSMAEAGNLIVAPAGPLDAVERIKPYLEGVIARSVVDLSGEQPSKASLLKIIGNVLIMTTIEQVAELLVFAEKSSLGGNNIRKLLAALYPGGQQQHMAYSGLMMSGEYHRRLPIVTVDAAIRLTSKVLTLAESHDVKLKAYEVAIDHLKAAKEANGGETDILGIYGAVRKESGLKFKTE